MGIPRARREGIGVSRERRGKGATGLPEIIRSHTPEIVEVFLLFRESCEKTSRKIDCGGTMASETNI